MQELNYWLDCLPIRREYGTYTGKIKGSGSITLNSRYLLDSLHALTGEDVVFGFNGKLEPSSPRNPADSSYIT